MTQAKLAREAFIAQLQASIEETQAKLDRYKSTLLGEGYVVCFKELPGFALSFDINDQRVIIGYKPVSLVNGNYNMFTKQKAEILASDCRNGSGDFAVAMHIKDALQFSIDEDKKVIAMIEAL